MKHKKQSLVAADILLFALICVAGRYPFFSH